MREGRPREMKSEERGKPVSLYLDPSQVKALDEIRRKTLKSLSSVVREAIDLYISKNVS
jgi:predicted transcriptional regulator